MGTFIKMCKDVFQEKNLYKVMCLEKSASPSDVKKAYYRLSLKYHPDKMGKEAAEADRSQSTVKFQTLSKIYSILSDKEKRAVYDETGEVDDDDMTDEGKDWWKYWRVIFKKVTVEDIRRFEDQYKESAEEVEDVLNAYRNSEGDMGLILDTVPLAGTEDHDRFYQIITDHISQGKVDKVKKFKKLTKKQLRARCEEDTCEAAEAEKVAEELGLRGSGLGTDESSLQALIQRRNQERDFDGFCDSLLDKYGPGGKGTNTKTKRQQQSKSQTSTGTKKKTKK